MLILSLITVFTLSRPSHTVNTPRTGMIERDRDTEGKRVIQRGWFLITMACRHQGRWRHKPQEGRLDTSRPPRLRKCHRGREADWRNRHRNLRPVRKTRTYTYTRTHKTKVHPLDGLSFIRLTSWNPKQPSPGSWWNPGGHRGGDPPGRLYHRGYPSTW